MENKTIILPCKLCGIKTFTKQFDSRGKEITELLCWNCISIDLEERNASNYIQMAKHTNKKSLRLVGKNKQKRGVIKKTFDLLPETFNVTEIFEKFLIVKEELGEAVFNDWKTKRRTAYNYALYWIETGQTEKIGKGHGKILYRKTHKRHKRIISYGKRKGQPFNPRYRTEKTQVTETSGLTEKDE